MRARTAGTSLDDSSMVRGGRVMARNKDCCFKYGLGLLLG